MSNGKHAYDSGISPDTKYYNDYHFAQAGWVCPKCHKIWSPQVLECYSCNNCRTSIKSDKF